MKYTNVHNLPEPIVRALTKDGYSRGASNRSVTQLIDSPRAQILRNDFDDRVEIDVSELLWITLGRTMHHMFEGEAKGKYLPEERLFAEHSGWTISGAIDIQHDEGSNVVTLTDYKMTSVWSIIFGKKEWDNQLNFYAWLARTSKHVNVKALKVLAVLRDWKQGELMRGGSEYPKAPIMEIDIPLWTCEEQESYVAERIRIHQEAEFMRLTGTKLPLCTDDERWKSPTKYAVKKPKNKTAKRVLSSFEEATQYITDNEMDPIIWAIEERPSDPKRCSMGYCKIAQWCDQYQGELNAQPPILTGE